MACYLYAHFTRDMLLSDMSFYSGPCPGEQMPDFHLPTTTESLIAKNDFLNRQPLLLTFASVTDAMTASSVPTLKRLFNDFGDRVSFVSLYVREAHPGERFPQPRTFDQKAEHARSYQRIYSIPWPVAIDTITGDLHNALDPKTNAIYLMGIDGRVMFRSLWSNDEGALREALTAVLRRPQSIIGQREARFIPLLAGLGDMHQALALAGHGAERDFLVAAPPAYIAARIAVLLRPLRPIYRGIAGSAVVMLGISAAMYCVCRTIQIRRGGPPD